MTALRQLPLSVVDTHKVEYLSHSAAGVYQTCPRKYQHRYKDRLTTVETSVNLVFGSAIDEATSAYIVGHALGQAIDPEPVFVQAFTRIAESSVIAYSTKFNSQEECITAGRLLLQRFVAKWLELGYIALLDPDGKPLVQVELRVSLPTNIVFTAIMDVIVMTPAGKVLIVDIKTPSQPCDEAFAELSDQLTGYQLAVETHRAVLGIDHVDGVAFFELVKRPIPKSGRGTGPEALTPIVCEPRSKERLEEFVQSRVWIAEDIRRGRFPIRAMDAYSTPCDMCDYQKVCRSNSREGLVVRPPRAHSPRNDQQKALEVV
jgi:hypothetical protein